MNPEEDSMSERFYAIRRLDGEPILGEYAWMTTSGPDDWEPAEADAEYGDGIVDYELVEMTVRPLEARRFGTHEFEPTDDSEECDRCGWDRGEPVHQVGLP